MFCTLLCFFGTGNIASLSSFDPLWTRHFLTVFSPFTMTGLILLKITIPMILIGCLIQNIETGSKMFLAVLFLADCLVIPLMFNVTPYGSWLDIGSAISRFVIAMVLPCVLLIIRYLAQPFVAFSLPEFIFSSHYKKQMV